MSAVTTPIRRLTSSGALRVPKPITSTVPASGDSSVQMIRRVVVLPAPFGPSSPKISPGLASKETPRSTLFVPSVFSRRSTATAAAVTGSSLVPGSWKRLPSSCRPWPCSAPPVWRPAFAARPSAAARLQEAPTAAQATPQRVRAHQARGSPRRLSSTACGDRSRRSRWCARARRADAARSARCVVCRRTSRPQPLS